MNQQSLLNDYVLYERVAIGGAAELQLAIQSTGDHAGMPLLLKRPLPHLHQNEAAMRRFEEEARLIRDLNHPNVPHFVDYKLYDGVPHLALRYIPGFDLRQLIGVENRNHSPPPELVAYIGAEISMILSYVHGLRNENGVQLIHRDVTPENIILGLDGRVHLIDFGLARGVSSEAETTINLEGKLGFEAPETIATQLVDERTDIYTLGLSLYQFWTSATPSPKQDYLSSLMQFKTDVPSASNLAEVLAKCLAHRPTDRFEHADLLGKSLKSVSQSFEMHRAKDWLQTACAELVRGEEQRVSQTYVSTLELEAERTQALSADDYSPPSSLPSNSGIEVSLIGRNSPLSAEAPPRVTAAFEMDEAPPQPTLIEDVSRELTGRITYPVLNLKLAEVKSLLVPLLMLLSAALVGAVVSNTLFARSMDRRVGQIMLDVMPSDQLSVSLNGQLRSSTKTPMFLTSVKPGNHQLVITRPGYKPVERTLLIEPNSVANVNLTLKPSSPPTAAVTFQIDIPSCNLSFGDRILAITNGETVRLPATQPLDLTLSAAGTDLERKLTVQLQENESLNLRFSFDPQ